MSTSEDQPVPTPASSATGGLTWRWVAVRAAFAIPIIFILLMIAYMVFIPFFLPFIVVFGGVGWWASRGGRASLIVLGILGIIFIALNAPFILDALTVPASVVDFVSSGWLLLAALTLVVASFAGARAEGGAAAGPRMTARVVGALAVVALIVSVVSFVTYDEAEPQPGDIALVAEDIEFQNTATLVGEAGTVAVVVTNEDPTFHTFTIDELDVHLDIPANSTARIEFEADAGKYVFYCVPHEQDMEGVLEVR